MRLLLSQDPKAFELKNSFRISIWKGSSLISFKNRLLRKNLIKAELKKVVQGKVVDKLLI